MNRELLWQGMKGTSIEVVVALVVVGRCSEFGYLGEETCRLWNPVVSVSGEVVVEFVLNLAAAYSMLLWCHSLL